MPDAEQQTKAVSQLTQDEDEYEEEVVHDDDDNDDDEEDDENGEAATCSALCSMGTSDPNAATAASACAAMKKENSQWEEFSTSNSCCPKQLQLPMFLSSTYPFVFFANFALFEIAGSSSMDNIVVVRMLRHHWTYLFLRFL